MTDSRLPIVHTPTPVPAALELDAPFSLEVPCCYACEGARVGFRDRRPEGGRLEHACERHADPRVDAAPGPGGELVRINVR